MYSNKMQANSKELGIPILVARPLPTDLLKPLPTEFAIYHGFDLLGVHHIFFVIRRSRHLTSKWFHQTWELHCYLILAAGVAFHQASSTVAHC